jgi:GNAT superfamily N-acetyltransferase
LAPKSFEHPVSVSLEELRIEPFRETHDVKGFDCGNGDLNDFLCTSEVSKYEKLGLGTTYLVYRRGDLVAYFTVNSDSMRVEYLKTARSFSEVRELRLEAIPGFKIGRLAVDTRHQNRGIGRTLIKCIAGMALEGKVGVRILMVQAKPESVSFYEKCGFKLTDETRRERGRRNRTMFLDLHSLP